MLLIDHIQTFIFKHVDKTTIYGLQKSIMGRCNRKLTGEEYYRYLSTNVYK